MCPETITRPPDAADKTRRIEHDPAGKDSRCSCFPVLELLFPDLGHHSCPGKTIVHPRKGLPGKDFPARPFPPSIAP
ncbi:hypothetical protein SAMN04489718_1405 [Actinopolyspora saharensis]|uniref:Uncharacterized protein n=1 Tax=Actinopolyspora saharensis TaxID=995062 RepID=A0A1H1A4D1_9ACTN|nr:hypothetical protein SAMN04489718_1405 [Actinopolyspora saharensis]